MTNTVSEENYLNEDGVARLSRLVQYFEDAESASVTARELAERDRDYYDNFNDSQWTEEEKKALEKRKQPITTSNRIKPKINYMLGEEAKRRSLPKAHPRTPKDEGSAGAATDGLRYIVDDNKYQHTRSAVFKNMCIEGYGGVEIRAEQLPMSGPTAKPDYKIRILPLKWDRIFFDAHSREPDFSDAKYLGQVIWMDAADAQAEYPDAAEVLAKTWTLESSMSNTYEDAPRNRWTDTKRKRIRIAEVWHEEAGVWYHCVYTKGGIISEIESPYKDEHGKSLPGIYLQSCFVDRDGNRYGVARDWISIQDEINKRRSKALHLISVRQTKGEKGAVDDVRKTKTELAKPDGHIEVNPGMDFEVLRNDDMSQGNFNLLAEAKSEIDSLGVNAQMAGSDMRNMSGRALMKREESGMSEIGPVYDMLNMFDHAVYRAAWSMAKQFWTSEKWIRITDDENVPRFVGLNQPMTLGEQLLDEVRQSGQPVTPEMDQQAKMDPRMQQIVGTKNNIAEMDVDIVIDSGPASATIQAEQFAELADLAKIRPDIPTQAVIEASSLRNKEKLLKMMGKGGDDEDPRIAQQTQQMQEMDQAIQGMTKELEQAKSDRSMEAAKLEIDQYNARTNRLKLEATAMTPEQMQALVLDTLSSALGVENLIPDQQQIAPMSAENMDADMTDSEKLDKELNAKIMMKRMELMAQIRMKEMDKNPAIAQQSDDPFNEQDENFEVKQSANAIEGLNQVMQGMVALAQEIGSLKQIMSAPKVLVRDEQGRPVGARIASEHEMMGN